MPGPWLRRAQGHRGINTLAARGGRREAFYCFRPRGPGRSTPTSPPEALFPSPAPISPIILASTLRGWYRIDRIPVGGANRRLTGA
jgi:hypothetical protein